MICEMTTHAHEENHAAPDYPTFVKITFENGVAVQLNDKEFNPEGIKSVLDAICSENCIESSEAMLSSAFAALHEKSGAINMKLYKGSAIPFSA